MNFAKRQIFFISLILSLSMFFAPFAQELYAESLFTKLKDKAKNFINNTVEKYTSRDYWVDKAASAITTNLVSKPVKLATSALGIALGTAIGGPVGATLGAYLGNKIGGHVCDIIGKPIVKNVLNERIETGEKVNVSSVLRACKNLDMPSLACDTTGAIIGDIFGSAIGGILGATITACVGGGTIIPIIGTITFATLGSKYGKKLGNWLGKKIGEKFFNKSYKALTGIDRTEDNSADQNILLSTAKDIASVNKSELAKNTTCGIVGDVIGSVIGTVAGATLSAVTTGGTSEKMVTLGEKWGSKIGTKVGKWLGNVFSSKSQEEDNNTVKVSAPSVSSSQIVSKDSNNTIYENSSTNTNDFDKPEIKAAYEAYLTSYDNYAKALSDSKISNEYREQMQKEYNACFEMYRKLLNAK